MVRALQGEVSTSHILLWTPYPGTLPLPVSGSLQPQSQSPSGAGDGDLGHSWVLPQAQLG